MSEQELGTLRLVGVAIAMLFAVAWQRLSPHSSTTGSTRVNAGLWIVNVVITGTICGACVCSTARWAAGADFGLLNQVATPTWFAVVATVFLLDLLSYGWHRATHAMPFLWRWHQVHHSDPALCVSTALRFHPGELLLSLPVRITAVAALGAPVEAVVLFEVLFTLANAVEHGNIDLPRGVEARMATILITPALHRWHHTTAVPERDSNFGTIFSIWDRLFGTYTSSSSDTRVRTGLPGLAEVSLGDALLLPLRRA